MTSTFRALTNNGWRGITSPSSPPSTSSRNSSPDAIKVPLLIPRNGFGYGEVSSSTPGWGIEVLRISIRGPTAEVRNAVAYEKPQ